MAEKALTTIIDELYTKHNISDEQKEFFKKYSRTRTAKLFEKKALETIGSAELKKDWIYNGYMDTGYFGGGKCSMGHTLRYVHFAKNIITNEEIKFGVKCVSDFFSLTEHQLRFISHGIVEVNYEIIQSLQFIEADHDITEYVKIGELFSKFSEVKHLISANIREEMQEWVNIGLPFPYRLMKVLNSTYARMHNSTEFQMFLSDNPVIKEYYTKAQEFVCNPEMSKFAGVLSEVKKIMENVHYYKNLQDWQRAKLDKFFSTDYDKVLQLVQDLTTVREKFNMRNFMESIAVDIMSKYDVYGVSEKQMAILEKVYAKYEKSIDELKLAQC